VFAIEAAGLALCIPLLRAVDASGLGGRAHASGEGELAEAAAIAAFEPSAIEMVAVPGGDTPAAAPPKRPAARRKSASSPAARTRKNGAARVRPKTTAKAGVKAKRAR
jgi:hypothetical protein